MILSNFKIKLNPERHNIKQLQERRNKQLETSYEDNNSISKNLKFLEEVERVNK